MLRGLGCATSSVFPPFFGSNPPIGCFESISVNMAEIMLPNLASKRGLFVKLVWYSRHTQINHLVAVFALSQRNITLCDLVALSLATSLKWVMIINPTGHMQWNHIDLQTHAHAYQHHHKHTYQCANKSPERRTHPSTIKIFHFKSLFTVQRLCRCSVHTHYRDIVKVGFPEYRPERNV